MRKGGASQGVVAAMKIEDRTPPGVGMGAIVSHCWGREWCNTLNLNVRPSRIRRKGLVCRAVLLKQMYPKTNVPPDAVGCGRGLSSHLKKDD
jgi:hypothetical protein